MTFMWKYREGQGLEVGIPLYQNSKSAASKYIIPQGAAGPVKQAVVRPLDSH